MQAPLHRQHSSGGPPAPSYGTLPAPDQSGNHNGDHARLRDVPEEEEEEEETVSTLTLRCFVCICLGVFLGDASRGLVTPSLAPYVKEAGGDASFIGWTNGLYSMGRLVAAPLFGWWCEQRTYREAILINLTLFFIGNLMYALAEHHKWLILFSRLLVGLGSGTLGLSRGYVAQTTSSRDRSGYMAWLTGAQFVGYSVTPGLGALFSFLNFTIVGSLQLNTYTTAGYLMAVGSIVNAMMMFTAWIEPPKPSTSDDEQMTADKESTASSGLCEFFSTASSSILLFVVLMFMTRYVVAVYETSSQLIAIDLFNWSVLVFGLATCVFGIVGTCVLFLTKPISRTVPDHWVLVFGLGVLSLGLFVFPPLSWFGGHRGAMVVQYNIGSVLIFGLGYPISQALLLSFFSKALGSTPQSTIMGMMASLGSAAKVLGALIAGWSHQIGHTGISFYIPGVILSLSTMGTAHYFFKKLHKVKG